ncbi:hypothetical protein GTO27_11990 [Candidatus Bathyarchaeota archaeon]|nr:hypothetical protein [Candidatus Bathyarchaeota archaeon]
MPYYRIRYGYSRSGEGVRKHNVAGQGETALNAMFCGSVESEEEIISLFRPNYLEHETVWTTPQSKEIVGSTAEVDFDGTLNGLLKHLNKVKDELYELRS